MLARSTEISSRATMKAIIIEEWNGLEFEEVKEKGWWGVNNYVKEWERVLKAVVREKGYDTEYM